MSKFKTHIKFVLMSVCVLSFAMDVSAFNIAKVVGGVIENAANNSSYKVASAGSIEVAFSPKEGAEALVVKAINSARDGGEILMLAYNFTSGTVTRALLNAKHRGVNIRIVADHKSNVAEDWSGKARAAMSALATSGVDMRTISAYAIHHDKVMIIDRQTVEIGSFNYSDAAANRNSENVMVNWDNPELAKVYMKQFERNYKKSEPYKNAY